MTTNSLIYSNARVKSLENTLLSQEKINRMAYSETLEDAVKVLLESNYGSGTISSAYDFEEILHAEDKKVNAFMAESMIPNMGIETFIIKNDYHNAKAIVKAKYMHEDDFEYMLAPKGMIEINELKAKIFNDEYDSLYLPMAEALKTIDEQRANGKKSPRDIDVLLDKALYKNIFEMLKSTKATSIVNYWKSNVDFSNISTFIRCHNIGQDVKFFNENFIEGGEIDLEKFTSVYDNGPQVLLEKLKLTKYSNVLSEINPSDMVSFEVIWDNYLLNIFKNDRYDVFSIAPLAGFYVAKMLEIKVVRMILILVKNKVDASLITKRLREYYE